MKRALAVFVPLMLVGGVLLAASATAAETVITYNIPDARAYAYRASVSVEVIQLAGSQDEFRTRWIEQCDANFPAGSEQHQECIDNAPPPSCDPETDQYKCDSNSYNRTLNCHPAIALGPDQPGKLATLPGGAQPRSGGAGVDDGSPPPQPSPVWLNELPSVAHLGRGGVVLDGGGFASDAFVDLSGPMNKELHTFTDAFTVTFNDYEERCLPETSGQNPQRYKHVLSRSGEAPNTYHLAECVGTCTFGPQEQFTADKAETIAYLREEQGKVFGTLTAHLRGFSMAGCPGVPCFSAESLFTLISFESDGTAAGLRWQVLTTASNTRVLGQQTPLAPGGPPAQGVTPAGAFTVGVAAPIVRAGSDGGSLQIFAPGLVVATSSQTVYLGGAELDAGFGREVPFVFTPGGLDTGTFVPGSPGASVFVPGTPGQALERGGGGSLGLGEGSPLVVAVENLDATPWPVILILSFGVAALLVMLSGWIRRFSWGSRLFEIQPFRTFDWLHRAFVKT